MGIKHGEMITVKSRRGEVKVKAKVTKEVPQGMVWMAFHFREACANWLTNPVFDPVSQTAEYKACAVRIEKIVGEIGAHGDLPIVLKHKPPTSPLPRSFPRGGGEPYFSPRLGSVIKL